MRQALATACLFPTCQVRVVRFYVNCLLRLLRLLLLILLLLLVFSTTIHDQCSLPDLNCDHPRPVFAAGTQPRTSISAFPAGPIVIIHAYSVPCRNINRESAILSAPSVPCRTSTTTIHAQCSLPDLHRDHPRQVFPAGPQPRPSAPSVPSRTSTATIHAQCSYAGPQPRPSTPSFPCRTSTATIHAQEFPAGPQPQPSAPSVPCRTSTTTIEFQEERQKGMPGRMPERMPAMPDRRNKMPERMPDRKSE